MGGFARVAPPDAPPSRFRDTWRDRSSRGVPQAVLWTGIALIGVNWAWTALVSVPLHRRLDGPAVRAQHELVATNWIRTATWSARGAWALFALSAVLGRA